MAVPAAGLAVRGPERVDLNMQRPRCEEHDNPQVAKSRRLSGSSVASEASVSGWVPPARPSPSGPRPEALACLGSPSCSSQGPRGRLWSSVATSQSQQTVGWPW